MKSENERLKRNEKEHEQLKLIVEDYKLKVEEHMRTDQAQKEEIAYLKWEAANEKARWEWHDKEGLMSMIKVLDWTEEVEMCLGIWRARLLRLRVLQWSIRKER